MATENEIQLVSRGDLKDKIDRSDDFTLVEVLGNEQFEDFHLPGAINIPGNQLREKAPERIPDKDREGGLPVESGAAQLA